MKHKHHIIPRHIGGSDDPSNLIELTVEEHAEAHRILWEKHGRWQDEMAWKALSAQIGKEEAIEFFYSNLNKGRIVSEESKKKMSDAKKGRKISKKHADALHQGRRNSKNSEEHNLILKQRMLGNKMSDEIIAKSVRTRKQNNDTVKLASNAGKISAEKYKNDPIRQKEHSERMKLWWSVRKQSVGG